MSINIPVLGQPSSGRSPVQSLGLVFSALAIAAVFAIDFLSPAGVAIPFLYVLILWSALWWARTSQVVGVAAAATLLTVIHPWITAQGIQSAAVINSAIALLSVWFLMYFGLSYRRMVDAMQNRERELSDFADTAPLGIKWVAPNGVILWANGEELRMLGYDRDEYVGRPVGDFVRDRAAADEILDRFGKNIALKDHEARMRCKDGSVRHVTLSTSARSEGGKLVHLRCFTQDVTARRHAEEEVSRLNRELEQRVRARTADLENEIRIRQQAEAELGRYRALLEATFESSPAGISLTDVDGKFLKTNAAYRGITGYSVEELSTRTFEDVTHPDDRRKAWERRSDLIAGLRPSYVIEKRYVTKAGSPVYVRNHVSLVREQPVGEDFFITVSQEITADRRAREALAESENKLRLILDHTSDMITILDNEGRWVYGNRSCNRLFGKTERLYGTNAVEQVHADDRGQVQAAFVETLKTGGSVQTRYRVVDSAGRARMIESEMDGIRDEAGWTSAVIAVGRDITDRLHAEQVLREREELLRITFDSAPVGINMVGLDQKFVRANAAYLKMVGYSETELLNITPESITHEADLPRNLELRRELFEGKWDSFELEKRYITKNGRPIWVHNTVSLVRDDSGNPRFTVAVAQDVTDRKLAEQALRESEERLKLAAASGRVGLWEWNVSRNALNGDDEFNAVFGLPAGMPVVSPRTFFLKAIHAQDRRRVCRVLLRGLRTDADCEDLFRIVRPDGRLRWVNARGRGVPNAEGNPGRLLGAIVDVTERKTAEIALRENYEILDRIFDTTHFCIVYLDRDFNFIRVNRAYADACGHPPEFFIGKNHFALYPGEEIEAIFRRVVTTGEPYTTHARPFEFPDHPEWGVTYWDWTVHSLRDAGGAVEGLLFALLDVTERERAGRAARESGLRLQLAIQAGNIGFWDREIATGHTYFSPEWKRQLGYRGDEIGTRHEEWESRLHAEDRERVRSHLAAYLGGVQSDYRTEYRLRHKDGSYRWIYAQGSRVRDASGELGRLVGCHVDITEFKRTQFELERKTALARLLESLARAANEASTAEGALRASLDHIRNYGGWTLAHVVTIKGFADPDGDIRQWTSRQSGDTERVAAFMEYSETKEHLAQPGIFLGAMMRDQQPVWLPDLTRVQGHNRMKMARELGLRAAFCFPVVSHGEAIAFLEFFSDQVCEVDDMLLSAVGTISGQLARSIERSRAEHTTARLAAIVENSSDAIVSRSVDYRILTWNAAAERLFGYGAAEVIGRNISLLIPPEKEAETARNRKMLEQGRLMPPYDTARLAGDGRRIDVSTTPSPIKDRNGSVIGVSLVFRDIRERVQAERRRAMEHAVTHVLARSGGVTETMPELIETLCRAMQWHYGAYWVWSAGDQTLQRVERWSDFVTDFDHDDEQYWSRVADRGPGGLLRRALSERKPVWIADVGEEPSFRRRESVLKLGLINACAFPILIGGDPIGVMEFFGRGVRSSDQGLLEIMGVIGNQIGQFIRRKLSEEAQRASEAMLSAMFELAAVGIGLLDNDPREPHWLRVNQKLCDIVGYSREELLRMSSRDISLPEDRPVATSYKEKLLRDGMNYSREKRYRRKDGRIIWTNISVSAVRGPDGRPSHVISVVEDITDRKQAEVDHAQLAAIVQSSNDAIISRSLDGGILSWNAAAERLFGWSAPEALGRAISLIFPPDRALSTPFVERVVRGEAIAPIETTSLRKDGAYIQTQVTISPVVDTQGNIVAVSNTVRDITDLKRKEEALRNATARLRMLSRRLREVEETQRRAISRELHDRIGPEVATLNLMLGLMEVRLSAESRAAVGAQLRDLRELMKSITTNVRDVMAELRPPVLDDYGLPAALRHFAMEFAKRTGISVQVDGADFKPRLPIAVELAMFRISQEAFNNIAKHAQAQRVEVGFHATPERAVVKISDDGVGFDPERAAEKGGSWGITIMHERAEAEGVTLRVKSAPGRGTQVMLEAERSA